MVVGTTSNLDSIIFSYCIADYYNMGVFSEEHWSMIDKFVKTAVNTGITMILTPVFTPPLDTDVGGRRTAVQLVDVSYLDGKYTFGFDKLKRWIDMCRANGIKQFEISHLFTQWGSGNAPMIIVKTQNGYEVVKSYYICENCEGCPHRQKCYKGKYGNRKIGFSKTMARQKTEARRFCLFY